MGGQDLKRLSQRCRNGIAGIQTVGLGIGGQTEGMRKTGSGFTAGQKPFDDVINS